MISNKTLWLNDIADLFINLSAGWFGAAFIISAFNENIGNLNFGLLILNGGFGILFLLVAHMLRKKSI